MWTYYVHLLFRLVVILYENCIIDVINDILCLTKYIDIQFDKVILDSMCHFSWKGRGKKCVEHLDLGVSFSVIYVY